jgi:eukaryotic-like serine/threonine-protein kinase
MPDPTLRDAPDPAMGEVDPCESKDMLVGADTKPAFGLDKNSAFTVGSQSSQVSGVRPGSTFEAYKLLNDFTQPVAIADYLVEAQIGQGGMGTVFRARHMTLDREVALKVLARHLVDDEKFVHRFEREARVMARLDHRNIIRCFDVGEEFGLRYLVMELVDGWSLFDLIAKHGVFSVGDALFVTLQVAEALQYAHERNLVHRDIKPDNVLVSKVGAIKLADLGLAKPVNDDLSMTASGVGAGTPTYMAPEQMRSAKEVDGRADIYALGAMLYVMLAGRIPFEGDNLVKLLEAKEKGKYKPLRKINSRVPDKLDAIIEKMLAKSLTARYQTCAEVIADIESLGLANTKFSLFHRDARPALKDPMSRPMRPGSKDPVSRPASKRPASEARPASREVDDASGPAGWWYIVVGLTIEGKKRVRKLTQEQVNEYLSSGRIDLMAEASRQPAAGYRALGSYPEFEGQYQGPAVGNVELLVAGEERKRWWGWVSERPRIWVAVAVGILLVAVMGYFLFR